MRKIALSLCILVNCAMIQGSPCLFYKEINDAINCPKTNNFSVNYLVDYGYKYCEKFLQKETLWNDERSIWIAEVRECLKEELSERDDLTCQNVKTIGFNSHPKCYEKAGFCNLSPAHQKSILKEALGLDILRTPYLSFKQGITLLLQCATNQ